MKVRKSQQAIAETLPDALAVLWMAVALLAWAGVVAGKDLPEALSAAAGVCLAYGWLLWLGMVAAGIILGAVRLLNRERSR
ncbi:MAG: hypothetical protein KatS3mg024_0553 [Armatimonadota bacterium]|nr:MAG: hypothetical protein KatS3mg024_0553 [Armatimonadota bacterium]